MEEGTGPSLFDPDVLRRLVARLQGTDVDELEIRDGTARLYLRREPGAVAYTPVSPSAATPSLEERVAILAPLAGVFYSRSEPTRPPFVELGNTVLVGQVVALIETMKLFNEVTAETAGELVSVEVHDGEMVEVGQPLFFLVPSSEEEQAPPLNLM